jgi:hypothetical protein
LGGGRRLAWAVPVNIWLSAATQFSRFIFIVERGSFPYAGAASGFCLVPNLGDVSSAALQPRGMRMATGTTTNASTYEVRDRAAGRRDRLPAHERYYKVISRAIAEQSETTFSSREALYEKARAAQLATLQKCHPPLTMDDLDRERLALEQGIDRVEQERTSPQWSRPHLVGNGSELTLAAKAQGPFRCRRRQSRPAIDQQESSELSFKDRANPFTCGCIGCTHFVSFNFLSRYLDNGYRRQLLGLARRNDDGGPGGPFDVSSCLFRWRGARGQDIL